MYSWDTYAQYSVGASCYIAFTLVTDTDNGCNKEVAVGDLAATEVSCESLLGTVAI